MATVSGSQRGFTLLEVVVSAGVLVLFLAISLSLIDEAGRRVAYSGLRAGETDTATVLNRLRADVQGATSIGIPPSYDPYAFWHEGPLVLRGHWSGSRISYELTDRTLYRTVHDTEESQPAPVLSGVDTFHWILVDSLGLDVVMIEVVREQSTAFRMAGGADAQFGVEQAVARLVVAPRRMGRTSW